MVFKTMLAGKADPTKLRFPVLVSPKLDGVRCHVISGEAVSRNLKPFRNPMVQEMFGRKEFNGLDGELMVGDPTDPEAFRQTGVLNSLAGDCSKVKLFVFDNFSEPHQTFLKRLESAQRLLGKHNVLAHVPHITVHDIDHLAQVEAEFLEQGYEGAMIRDPNGPYKFGRSTTNEGYLLKLKRFEDGEAEVIGVEEKMHNANEKTLVRNGKAVRNTRKEGKVATGVLGAVQVRDLKTGVEFSVGSGFTDSEREQLWAAHMDDPEYNPLNGLIIRYQYFPTGSKDKPRFPTFKGFRDRGDL